MVSRGSNATGCCSLGVSLTSGKASPEPELREAIAVSAAPAAPAVSEDGLYAGDPERPERT